MQEKKTSVRITYSRTEENVGNLAIELNCFLSIVFIPRRLKTIGEHLSKPPQNVHTHTHYIPAHIHKLYTHTLTPTHAHFEYTTNELHERTPNRTNETTHPGPRTDGATGNTT